MFDFFYQLPNVLQGLVGSLWIVFILLLYSFCTSIHDHVPLIRYTKALEVIKKLHKDQAHEIKTYKLKLENLQTLKDAAYKVFLLFSSLLNNSLYMFAAFTSLLQINFFWQNKSLCKFLQVQSMNNYFSDFYVQWPFQRES